MSQCNQAYIQSLAGCQRVIVRQTIRWQPLPCSESAPSRCYSLSSIANSLSRSGPPSGLTSRFLLKFHRTTRAGSLETRIKTAEAQENREAKIAKAAITSEGALNCAGSKRRRPATDSLSTCAAREHRPYGPISGTRGRWPGAEEKRIQEEQLRQSRLICFPSRNQTVLQRLPLPN